MTNSDLYVVACILCAVGATASLVGYAIDRWPEWRARNEEHRIAASRAAASQAARRRFDPSPRPRP